MVDLKALKALGASAPVVKLTGHYPRSPVERSRELDRVLAIPRHLGYSDDQRNALQAALLKPGATMTLRACQADSLLGALEAGGLFAPLHVGAGKTLIAALLATVLDAKRPLVLTTSALEVQTRRLFKEYAHHFYIRDDVQVRSYSLLSRPEQFDLLVRLDPDLIIADEVHALRDPKSARTKRFLRFFKTHAETIFCALSGTMTKRSIKDYAHLMRLALKDWTPLPRDYPTLAEWSEALDPEPVRPPGALKMLCEDDESPHEGFARRMRQTRGVAASPAEALGATLIVRVVEEPPSTAIAKARRDLQTTWERPDGDELTTALEVATVDHQLRLGGFYAWSTPPDREWLRARRMYRSAVRRWLSDHSREECDSFALVERAIERGELYFEERFEWLQHRDTPEPPKHWVWIDESTIAWAASREGTQLIFTDLVAVGRRVAELAGAPYFGEGPIAAKAILDETGQRSIVCSLQAHGQGRNLQMFSRALVLGVPPTGTIWEQMLGRLHRAGQLADEVEYIVPKTFEPELDRAMDDARYVEASTGQVQKLTHAVVLRGEEA